MNANLRIYSSLALLLLLVVLDIGGSYKALSKATSAGGVGNRIRFQIRMIEEISGQRKLLSEASVEGPSGTDFNINLKSLHFKMDSRFQTDLAATALKIRASLNTRRLYGNSEKGLLLYEEDSQQFPLELGFDETMLLLPFGRDEGSDKLRIEITPAKVEANNLSADMAQTPVINISKPAPGGLISIQAFKVPHRFEVETILLENGREVARGESVYLLEDEKKELALRPDISSSPAVAKNPLVLKLSVDNYASLKPTAQVGISFDVLRGSSLATAQAQEIALGWAGTALLGREFTFDLGEIYHPQADSKYQLRFKIRVAEAEAS